MSNDKAATILEQDVDYTVTLNDDQEAVPGGSITLLTPGGLKEGETLVIGSCLEYVKNIDLTNYSRFPPEQIDTEFNRIVIMIQQIVEETGRTLKVPATSSETPDDMIERLLAAQSQAQASADAAANSAQAAADSATEAEQIKEETAEYAEAAAIIKPYTAELQDVADNIEEVVAVGSVVLQNLAVYFLENLDLDFVDSAAVGLGFAPDFGQNCFAADFVLAVADFAVGLVCPDSDFGFGFVVAVAVSNTQD